MEAAWHAVCNASDMTLRASSPTSPRGELTRPDHSGTHYDGFCFDASGVVTVRLGDELAEADPAGLLRSFGSGFTLLHPPGRIVFESSAHCRQDALIVAQILALIRMAQAQGFVVDEVSLPDGLRKLLKIALAVPPRGPKPVAKDPFFVRIGRQTVETVKDSHGFFEFLGELTLAFGRLLRGKARFRKSDFWITLQSCGVDALPIVGLISILIGIILGFVGGVQLQRFGATILMVDLVALAMAREMGCIMTGVIMSGRTGAAFAAQIGSMTVNEEVDALSTLGFSPMEYLVLPRALAMILMMPLLTLYSDILGWIGGFIVTLPLGIGPSQYWAQLTGSMGLTHIAVGLGKSFFFGIIVAASGCYYGLRCGRSSASVGQAATSAVVAGITWIIVLDAVFAFILQFIGI